MLQHPHDPHGLFVIDSSTLHVERTHVLLCMHQAKAHLTDATFKDRVVVTSCQDLFVFGRFGRLEWHVTIFVIYAYYDSLPMTVCLSYIRIPSSMV